MSSYFFVLREGWKATSAGDIYVPHIPFSIVIHHSAIPRAGDYCGIPTVQKIQRLHQTQRGFADIGYHFIVGPDGVVYEGRPVLMEGAHVRGHNSGRIGICLLGDYRSEKDLLPPSGIHSLVSLCRFILRTFHLSPEEILGHKDLDPKTECPGEQLYSFLPFLRRKLRWPDEG